MVNLRNIITIDQTQVMEHHPVFVFPEPKIEIIGNLSFSTFSGLQVPLLLLDQSAVLRREITGQQEIQFHGLFAPGGIPFFDDHGVEYLCTY
nr:hypothetical protein [Acidithiobacillus ferrivorans]